MKKIINLGYFVLMIGIMYLHFTELEPNLWIGSLIMCAVSCAFIVLNILDIKMIDCLNSQNDNFRRQIKHYKTIKKLNTEINKLADDTIKHLESTLESKNKQIHFLSFQKQLAYSEIARSESTINLLRWKIRQDNIKTINEGRI